jgi:ribonuclease
MKRIYWTVKTDIRNPLGDPHLNNLFWLVRDFRRGRLPLGWRGNKVFENRYGDLPIRPYGYYTEFYRGISTESGSLRVVLGKGSEVYVTGNHYMENLISHATSFSLLSQAFTSSIKSLGEAVRPLARKS